MLHLVLLCAASLPGDAPVGIITHAVRGPDGATRSHTEPYVPQPGDLVLFDDYAWHWLMLYHMVGSAPPTHSGIIVRLPDGKLALLESGPDDCRLIGPYVALLGLDQRLHGFKGTLHIRRVRQPLNPQQCANLTAFALSQLGKRYATCRLLLQGTPFRCRNWLTRKWFGRTYQDRVSWLCSELVVAAGTAAGLFDAKRCPANAIYPLDMMEDTTFDLGGTWHKAGVWGPAR